jgi:hypothetical protein
MKKIFSHFISAICLPLFVSVLGSSPGPQDFLAIRLVMFVSHLCSFSLPDVCLAGEHTVRSRPSSSAIRARPDFHFPDLVFSARRWFGFPAGKWSASSLVF